MKILSKKSVREFCTSVQSISKFRPTFTLAGEYNSLLCVTKIFPFLLFTLHNGKEIEMKTLAVNCEDKSVNLDRKQNAYDFKSVNWGPKRSLSSNLETNAAFRRHFIFMVIIQTSRTWKTLIFTTIFIFWILVNLK